MFGEMFRLELRQQLRSPAFIIALIAFGGYSIWSIEDVSRLLARPGVAYNAPMLMAQLIALLGFANIAFAPLCMSSAILRDFEYRSDEVIFATHVTRLAYLGGRFCAGYAAALAITLACLAGVVIGQHMPWIDPGRIGPTPWYAFFWSMIVLVAPNTLLLTSFLALLAGKTRSLRATYVGLVVFEVARFSIAKMLEHNVSPRIGIVLDPFGTKVIIGDILRGTVDDINQHVPSLSGPLLINRLLWLCVSILFIGLAYITFQQQRTEIASRKARRAGLVTSNELKDTETPVLVVALQCFDVRTFLAQFRSLYRLDIGAVLRSAPFLITVVACLAAVIFSFMASSDTGGGKELATAPFILRRIHESLRWPLCIATAFYAGELMWRDRAYNYAHTSDAHPVSGGIRLASNVLSLCTLIVIIQSVCAVAGLFWHTAQGLNSIDLSEYAVAVLIDSIPYALFAVIALFFQALTNNRYFGYALASLWLLLTNVFLERMGWDNPLWTYGRLPDQSYSDLSSLLPSASTSLLFATYWGFGALILAVSTTLLSARSSNATMVDRWRDATERLRSPLTFILGIAIFGFLLLFWWIFSNTPMHSSYDVGVKAQQAADYEKKYGKYAVLPQPRISSVSLNLDMYPSEHRVLIQGHYTLTNETDSAIRDLQVQFAPDFAIKTVTLAAHQIVLDDPKLGYVIYRLDSPIPPGGRLGFDFKISHQDARIALSSADALIPMDGTFFTNALLPQVGYQPSQEIRDIQIRKDHALTARRENPKALVNNLVSNDSDWIQYEAVLSTDGDQAAITSGRLEKTWSRGGRNYYRYVADAPMINMMPFISGRYAVKSEKVQGVDIFTYYHPSHSWNVDRLLVAGKDSLSTYGAMYSRYPRAQLRLVETPGSTSAQSFPGVVVLPESEVFTVGAAGPQDIDIPYLVTAHEIAHQWWGHEVIGADLPGATMLTESMAQFSALMLLRKTHSQADFELTLRDTLERYVAGRGTNPQPEIPLTKVLGQSYVSYDKGAMALYALNEQMGDGGLEQALRQFLIRYRLKPDSYPTASALMEQISAGEGWAVQDLIHELFTQVVVYDVHLTGASATKLSNGKYQVSLDIDATRIELSPTGAEKSTSLRRPLEVAVLGTPRPDGSQKELFRGRVEPSARVLVTVDSEPSFALIDPSHLLLNRAFADTRKSVVIQ